MSRSPRKRTKRIYTSAVAHLPSSVELTKRNSDNSMSIIIRTGETLLGTLIMGRGSVEWWPAGHSVHKARKSWRAFAKMLDESMTG